MRCTHENPRYDHALDCNCFDEGEKGVVIKGEHEDPRVPIEEVHWGVGYHAPLIEVIEEYESSSEVSSSEVASPED